MRAAPVTHPRHPRIPAGHRGERRDGDDGDEQELAWTAIRDGHERERREQEQHLTSDAVAGDGDAPAIEVGHEPRGRQLEELPQERERPEHPEEHRPGCGDEAPTPWPSRIPRRRPFAPPRGDALPMLAASDRRIGLSRPTHSSLAVLGERALEGENIGRTAARAPRRVEGLVGVSSGWPAVAGRAAWCPRLNRQCAIATLTWRPSPSLEEGEEAESGSPPPPPRLTFSSPLWSPARMSSRPSAPPVTHR